MKQLEYEWWESQAHEESVFPTPEPQSCDILDHIHDLPHEEFMRLFLIELRQKREDREALEKDKGERK
jgi:hypothetical protein